MRARTCRDVIPLGTLEMTGPDAQMRSAPGSKPTVRGQPRAPRSHVAWRAEPVRASSASQTPGPAAYRQTDVQVTKFKAPQYTMAARVEPPGDKTLKPGPGAHSPEKVGKSIAWRGMGEAGATGKRRWWGWHGPDRVGQGMGSAQAERVGWGWRYEPAGVTVATHVQDAVRFRH